MKKHILAVVDLTFKFPEELGFIVTNLLMDFVIQAVTLVKNLFKAIVKAKRQYSKMLVDIKFNKQKAYSFESLQEYDRYLEIGDSFTRVYYLANLPNFVFSATLYRLVNLPIPLTLSYHIRGTNKAAMIRATRQRISVLESSRNSSLKNGKNEDPEQGRETQELNQFLNDLVSDQEKAFLAGIYVAISASSKEQLLEYDQKFQDETQNIELTFNTYTFAQKRAFQAVMPLNKDSVNAKHLLPTSAVINLLPFLTRNLNDPSGIFFGMNQYNNSLILLDLFHARNANMNIFGTSGSGKSVTAKLIITRLTLRNVQSIILDPEGEYGKLAESLGGQNIKLGSGFGMDPFIALGSLKINLRDRVQTLKYFFSFYIQEQNRDSSLLDKILMQLCQSTDTVNMAKFLDVLESTATKSNPGMCNDIRQLATGSLACLFEMSMPLDFQSQLICFDLSELKTDEQKLPFMYLIGSIINRVLDKADRRRMIFIDEAHKLLNTAVTTDFYIDLVKTARKRKAGIVSITQNPEDFKESDNSRTILTQAETTILLKQAPASINYISRFNLFRLTDKESSDLMTFAVGEALFIREREHIYLNIFPFPGEADFVFTS